MESFFSFFGRRILEPNNNVAYQVSLAPGNG